MIEQILTYVSYVLSLMIIVYLRQILLFRYGMSKLSPGKNTHQPTVTVIIAARNEEKNISRCLESLNKQKYPADKLSIIIIDDQSIDDTVKIVRSLQKNSPFQISLYTVQSHQEIRSPKIRALTQGIQHSSSEIIATTDADCIVQSMWIQTLISHFDEKVGIVAGVTIYEKSKDISSLFWGIQYIDFISYTAIAAGAIGLNRLLISNGSNMAFRRQAFDESGGFESIKHINGGIDSLLAQTIAKSGKWKGRFAIESASAISTLPVTSLRDAFYQRVRWVGQTAHYPPDMMFFMICTFIMFVGLSIALPLSIFYWQVIPWLVLGIKIFVDYLTMDRFTRITHTGEALKYFIPASIIHIPFIIISTISGYFFTFRWKERIMKKESLV